MKRFMVFLTIILSILFSYPVFASDLWDKTDIGLATTSLILKAVDWRQSLYIAENPAHYKEANLIMKEHPSKNDVNTYFAASTLIQMSIAHYLPNKWRKIWLSTWIGVSGSNVAGNYVIGIRW